MSNEINKAFVQQFSANIIHLAQQKGSRLLDAVMQKDINGKYAHFDRVGLLVAQEKTTRHAEVSYQDTPHSRRRVTIADFYAVDLVDDEDEVRLLIDPKSAYAKTMAWSLGRKIDDLILEAATGNSTSVDSADAGSNVALPSSQVVDEDFGTADSNLTLVKLIEAKRIMDGNDVDPSDERRYVVNADALANLLNDTTITSADYNALKPLVNGEIDRYLGAGVVRIERLRGTADGTDTDPVQCLYMAKSGMGFAKGRDISVKMDKIPERHYATQVYASMTGGSVRIEEEKVVKIECVQS